MGRTVCNVYVPSFFFSWLDADCEFRRGLYYKLQGPISMKSDIICKRSRHDARRGGVSASVCEIRDDAYVYDEPDPESSIRFLNRKCCCDPNFEGL
jgi:hypothetical protein